MNVILQHPLSLRNLAKANPEDSSASQALLRQLREKSILAVLEEGSWVSSDTPGPDNTVLVLIDGSDLSSLLTSLRKSPNRSIRGLWGSLLSVRRYNGPAVLALMRVDIYDRKVVFVFSPSDSQMDPSTFLERSAVWIY